MGIYTRYILEADDDEDNFDINIGDETSIDNGDNTSGETEELDLKDNSTNVDTDNATETQTEENNSDKENSNGDEEQDSNSGENSDTPTEDDDNFEINVEDDTNASDEETSSAGNDDNISDDLSSSDNTSKDDSKAKFDAALYDSLSDNEKANKDAELLSNYKDLYINCDNIIEKINGINKDVDNIKVIQRIACTLSDLKSYIVYYLDNNYKTKSYYENDVMFNKYLAILNGVKNVLNDFLPEKDAKNEKSTS